jgi:hypothetical protein
VAAVGGGWNNTAGGYAAVVSGGFNSTASGLYTTVSGGQQNSAGGDHATIGGGWVNQAQAAYSTIAGGGPSDTANPSTTNNKVTDDYGTVGGGCFNQAGNNAGTQQDRRYATVAGGKENTASGDASTIAGGDMNQATNGVAAVGGGWNNTASGYAAVVSGGFNSTASGQYATVSGGQQNSASGDYSFAAGRSANALHNGCFVWVDATGRATNSTAINQFRVRASGGVFFYSSSVNDTSGIQLAAGNSSWSALSDRHQKDNFREVDPAEVLEKVSAMPISTWNYKAQDPKFRHMGPMAQDLYAAFGLGESETAIDTIDADGVALAAIQGLNQRFTQRVAEKEREIAELRAELKDLKAMVRSMAAK